MGKSLVAVFVAQWLLLMPVTGSASVAAKAFNGVEFGQAPEVIIDQIQGHCETLETVRVDPPVIPVAHLDETHVLCRNYEADGVGKIEEISFTFGDQSLSLIEAVFGDGILQLAWILAGSGEEDRLRQALIAAYGPAISDNGTYEVFADGRVALRKDKHEILILSEELVPLYLEEFRNKP